MSIVIEKNVPLPKSRVPKLPLGEMEIGDSFLLEIEDPNDRRIVRQRVWRFSKNNKPKRFRVLKNGEDSVRVFRVEDHE